LLSAGSARAIERQWRLGGGLGFATLPRTDYGLGPALGLHGAYGLSDMFDAHAELETSLHWMSPGEGLDDERLALSSLGLGVSYKLDIIEWVPYFGLLGGYTHTWDNVLAAEGDPPFGRDELTLSAMLGVDYALRRDLGLGLALRYHLFASNFGDPQYLSVLVRAEHRFGW
jgi:hypothetical protein